MDMKHIMGTSRVYSIDDTIPSMMQNVNLLGELNEEFNKQVQTRIAGKGERNA